MSKIYWNKIKCLKSKSRLKAAFTMFESVDLKFSQCIFLRAVLWTCAIQERRTCVWVTITCSLSLSSTTSPYYTHSVKLLNRNIQVNCFQSILHQNWSTLFKIFYIDESILIYLSYTYTLIHVNISVPYHLNFYNEWKLLVRVIFLVEYQLIVLGLNV